MEPDIKEFLSKIINSISVILLWMIINLFLGIYKGWAVINSKLSIYNIIFYIWFLASLIFLFYYLYKKWK